MGLGNVMWLPDISVQMHAYLLLIAHKPRRSRSVVPRRAPLQRTRRGPATPVHLERSRRGRRQPWNRQEEGSPSPGGPSHHQVADNPGEGQRRWVSAAGYSLSNIIPGETEKRIFSEYMRVGARHVAPLLTTAC